VEIICEQREMAAPHDEHKQLRGIREPISV
jgi:hypothetical protein